MAFGDAYLTDAELLTSERACCDRVERAVRGDEFFGGEALGDVGDGCRDVGEL